MPYLNETGVDALWKKVKGIAGNKLTATSADSSYTVGLQDKDGNSLSTATIAAASTTAAGVMTKADKSKLNGIATGATKVTVDSSPDDTSNNPLSNKAVQAQFDSMQGQVDDLNTSVSAKQNKLTAGDNITISDTNVISATNTEYKLPAASSTTLGGIKVGNNLSMSSNNFLGVSDVMDAISCTFGMDSDIPVWSTGDHLTLESLLVEDHSNPVEIVTFKFEGSVFKLYTDGRDVYIGLRDDGYIGRMYAYTPSIGDVSQRIATTEFVSRAIYTAQTGAAMFQGTAADSTTILESTYKQGYYWVASAAFTLGTETLEAGDMVFATKDKGTASDTSDFSVVQANITAISTSYIDALN